MRAVTIPNQELVELASTFERPSHHDQPGVLSFPPFRLDLVEERLWNGERELRLRRKPFAILRHLAQHPGRLVTHSEIVEAIWGKVATSESLVRTHVRDLRRVIGEAPIETVVGRGYRFVAKMREVEEAAVRAAAPPGTRRLELVRPSGPARAGDPGEVTSSMTTTEGLRVLKRLADALASLSTGVTVVVIEYSARR